MPTLDPSFDSYIAKTKPFARPILEHLRSLVHQACPDTEEAIKWAFPTFSHKGRILCSMAGFKAHCTFGFWLGALIDDPHNILESNERTAMGNLGRITSMGDLPEDDIILGFIRQAMRLTDEGKKLPVKKPGDKPKQELEVPAYLTTALKDNPEARTTFEGFSFTNKKEYIEWLTDAKTEATRDKRLAQALEWMAEGKPRNWKYMKR